MSQCTVLSLVQVEARILNSGTRVRRKRRKLSARYGGEGASRIASGYLRGDRKGMSVLGLPERR